MANNNRGVQDWNLVLGDRHLVCHHQHGNDEKMEMDVFLVGIVNDDKYKIV